MVEKRWRSGMTRNVGNTMEEENTGVNESKVRSRQHIMAKDRKDFRKRMKDFIIHKYHQRYLHLDYTEYKLGRMDVHTSST